ncbi:MAG TPA: fumarylacetoacetate hydrolase family protein, partial [Tepidisphaeraceae bacterium]|nr:fumarylacetoacetate hydrolase family protein [Tepidisphaeraceae bacterium]
MRIARFMSGGKVQSGKMIDDRTALRIEGDLFGQYRVTDQKLTIDKLLSPIVPTDILCIGLNYREHAKESNSEIPKNPMLFIKASNTLNNPGDPIPMPRLTKEVDYECELAVVIGKTAKDVSRDRALDYVFGYTAANDVSARDWQREKSLGGGQFARGKSFDGFCPLGPWIMTRDEIPNPNALRIKTILNGQTMQDHTTGDMIFDVPALIES